MLKPSFRGHRECGLRGLKGEVGHLFFEPFQSLLCQLRVLCSEAAFYLLATNFDQCDICAVLRAVEAFSDMLEGSMNMSLPFGVAFLKQGIFYRCRSLIINVLPA